MKIVATALLLLAVPALAEEPVRGGELVFAVNAEPPNYDSLWQTKTPPQRGFR